MLPAGLFNGSCSASFPYSPGTPDQVVELLTLICPPASMNDENNPSRHTHPRHPHTPVWARQLDQVTPGCCVKLTEITKTNELVRICVSRKLSLIGLDLHVDKLVSNSQRSDWLCIISAGLKACTTMPGSWDLLIFKATEMWMLSAARACPNRSCLL